MVNAGDLVVGEVYDFRGRRGRVEAIAFNSNRIAEVTVAYGRSFQKSSVLRGSNWFPERIMDLGEPWQQFKQRKAREKNFRAEAAALSARLRSLPPEMGLSAPCISSSGRLTIHGDLEGLSNLVEAAERFAASSSDSALSDMLS